MQAFPAGEDQLEHRPGSPARAQTAAWTFASSASPGLRRAVATVRRPGRVRTCGAESPHPESTGHSEGHLHLPPYPRQSPAGRGFALSATSQLLSKDARARPTATGESGQEARQWAWAECSRRGLSCWPMGVGGVPGAGTLRTPANERGWSARGGACRSTGQ